MKSPLRSEPDAFRFLGIVIVGALLIIGAAALNTWVGLAVALVVVGGMTFWYWHQPSPAPAPVLVSQPPHEVHRMLVIANETVGGGTLSDELRGRVAKRHAEILVVAPALTSHLKQWTSDEDEGRAKAEERVRISVESLSTAGLNVRGEVGDSQPLQAIEDALRTFGADEIVISTHPHGRSHWLEQNLVDEARRRFGRPVTHIVVDLEAES
jgi:nucleotide-binding universal stress UspA family protein